MLKGLDELKLYFKKMLLQKVNISVKKSF